MSVRYSHILHVQCKWRTTIGQYLNYLISGVQLTLHAVF